MFNDLNLTDRETGYKTFRREGIQSIKFEENRFGFEPEITAKIAEMDLRIYEVGISYYRRAYKEGKKLAGKTALKQYIAFSIITDSDERLRILSVRIRQTWGPYPPLRAEQD